MIKIKRLKTGDLAVIYDAAKDNVFKQIQSMIYRGVLEPKLDFDVIDKLEFDVFMEIANAITDFSGLAKTALQEGKP